MKEMPFEIAYMARLQVDALNASERAELERLFGGHEPQAMRLKPHRADGYLISRLGNNKRVLWRRKASGTPEILGIADRSYAAA